MNVTIFIMLHIFVRDVYGIFYSSNNLQTTVFNIDNNKKMCLEQQISILEWVLKDHVTLKTGVMMQTIQLCITCIHFKCIKIENLYFIYNNNNFHIAVLRYFLSNKCSVNERRILFSKKIYRLETFVQYCNIWNVTSHMFCSFSMSMNHYEHLIVCCILHF